MLLKITTQFIPEGYVTNYVGTDEKEAKIDIQFDVKHQTRLVILALESILGYLKEQPEEAEEAEEAEANA
ncbi:MAG TPA: hypothetical protein GXX35_11295 [Thermoanaerobacterales bacterium]|nr:hypothetical protein [Thermoanaerobacterales bacterium]